jgi:HlyD family secretion protein
MLANQEASVMKAEAVERNAKRLLDRAQTLAGKGIAAALTLDNATRDAEVAGAEVAIARAQVENAKATIAQRQAQLTQAEVDLERTRIRSPIDGTVISRTVDIGQTVAASLQAPELFKIAQDLRRIRIEAQVNEADVGSVAEGNPVTFTVDAYPERRFEGRVTQVRLAATELNSVVTYTVIIEAANEDRRLFPGMTATVQIETDKREGVLRVPNDALRFRPRDRTLPLAAAKDAGSDNGKRGANAGRNIEQLKTELQLTDQQAQALREAMRKQIAEMRKERGAREEAAKGTQVPAPPWAPSSGEEAATRKRIAARIEEVLRPLLTEAQQPLFDRWKRGRENSRPGTVWVLGASGETEGRSVLVGIADDQYSEIVGGHLKDGERVVVRAREAKK